MAPLPPADLALREPETVVLPMGAIVERFYTVTYDPIYFDRSLSGRLNAPDGSYGVLYAAAQLRGAFAETFMRVAGRTLIPRDLLRTKARVRLKITRDLNLVKLGGFGLGRLGATAEVVHGGLPYSVPQIWSKAIYNLPMQPDGICYTARHDDEALCYAFFDRTPICVKEEARYLDIDQDWLWQIADQYHVGLSPF